MSHPPKPLDEIDSTLPETVQRFLRAGARLESIRLDRRGRWWHQGERVTHPRILALFSRSVDRTEGGTWVLRVPPFTYPIEVEATPLFVTRLSVDADSATLDASLSDGTREAIEPSALRYVEGGGIHAVVGDGRFEARFSMEVYVDFAMSYLEEGPDGAYRVRLGERVFPLRP